jgi:cell division septum initiation protein DivIVA
VRRKAMELKAYCADMRGEVALWKAKAYDLMRTVYGKSSQPDAAIAGPIGQLNDMIEELEQKIERLDTECPAIWDKEKAELERIISDMNEIWEDTWRRASEKSPDDF